VNIYVDAYLARLVGALEEDFPAVRRLVGHRSFHSMCRAYLERFPSRSPSLNPLGRKLPEFLAAPVKVPRRKIARDLAAVEVAMSEVFDGEAGPALQPADFKKMAPQALAGSRLDFVPTFRLLALGHAVNPFIDAVRHERGALPGIPRRRSWVAVYRRGFQVCRLDLTEPAHAGLWALLRGRRIADAVAAAARRWDGPPGDLGKQIRRWFGEWTSEGFFSRIHR
jgi:hypothetical protein